MKNNPSKLVYWTPRILSIIFILFLFLMSLDVFGNGLSFWQTVLALFMHNIPALILLAITIISWKKEIVGAAIYIIFAILYVIWVLKNIFINGFEWYYLAWIIQIAGIAFLIGYLFLIGWKKKKENDMHFM